jgi:hypothetical protein
MEHLFLKRSNLKLGKVGEVKVEEEFGNSLYDA